MSAMRARGSCTDASNVRTSPVDSTTGKTYRFAGRTRSQTGHVRCNVTSYQKRMPLRYTIRVLRETFRVVTSARKNARSSSSVSVSSVTGHRAKLRRQADHRAMIRLLRLRREPAQPHVVAHPVGERLHRNV